MKNSKHYVISATKKLLPNTELSYWVTEDKN